MMWEKISDKFNLTNGIDETKKEEVVEVEGIGRFRWNPMSKDPRYTHPPNVNMRLKHTFSDRKKWCKIKKYIDRFLTTFLSNLYLGCILRRRNRSNSKTRCQFYQHFTSCFFVQKYGWIGVIAGWDLTRYDPDRLIDGFMMLPYYFVLLDLSRCQFHQRFMRVFFRTNIFFLVKFWLWTNFRT